MAGKQVTTSEIVAAVRDAFTLTRREQSDGSCSWFSIFAGDAELDRRFLIRWVWDTFGVAVPAMTITTALRTLDALAE